MVCRINKRRMWAGRIMLENMWTEGYFVTLTYSDENLTWCEDGVPTLNPEDLRNFLKRFRKLYGDLRYFACGEYGDRTHRPHYHLAMFKDDWRNPEEQVRRAWSPGGEPIGHISIGLMNHARAHYIASYVVKKLGKTNPELGLRSPEFARMSRKPPLGARGMRSILNALTSNTGRWVLETADGIPASYRMGPDMYPVGLYWRNWMRQRLGYATKTITEEEGELWHAEYDQSAARAAAQKAERRLSRKTGI